MAVQTVEALLAFVTNAALRSQSLLALSWNCAKLEVIPAETSGEVLKGFVAPINVLSRDGVHSDSLRTTAVSSALLGHHLPDTRFVQMCIQLAAFEYDAASHAAEA